MSEHYWFLKRCPLFDCLTPDECRNLELHSRSRAFRKGEIVYLPQDDCDHVLLLLRGRVKIITLSPDGQESILALIEPGELFGYLALLDPSARNEQAQTIEASQILAIPREHVLQLVVKRPNLALSILKLVGWRLRQIENRLAGMFFRSSRDRTIATLLDLAERYGADAGAKRVISLKLSHQELANLIGLSRETVTLTLGQLQREGHLEIQRRRITIRNHRALVDLLNHTLISEPAIPAIKRKVHS